MKLFVSIWQAKCRILRPYLHIWIWFYTWGPPYTCLVDDYAIWMCFLGIFKQRKWIWLAWKFARKCKFNIYDKHLWYWIWNKASPSQFHKRDAWDFCWSQRMSISKVLFLQKQWFVYENVYSLLVYLIWLICSVISCFVLSKSSSYWLVVPALNLYWVINTARQQKLCNRSAHTCLALAPPQWKIWIVPWFSYNMTLSLLILVCILVFYSL